mgnify:CR=1 FL=1
MLLRLLRHRLGAGKISYVITDISQKTSLDGVYAAGDVCVKNLRHIVKPHDKGSKLMPSRHPVKAKTRRRSVRPQDSYINHFGELKDKYNVMSVPCMVLNDEKVSFGKKNIEQILDWIAR